MPNRPNQAATVADSAAKQEAKKKFESRLDEIIARGYIRIGTTGDYKPFTYLNPKTGQYEGYDIDAMKELAKAWAWKPALCKLPGRH
nr:transporter substrate-binding domain-containing protein [Anoxybacillus sediminis]